jgi:formyltetrahydrofolate hydrolase
MQWKFHEVQRTCRVVIAVSRHGHCLNSMLHRWSTRTLPIEVVAVVSNHQDMRSGVKLIGATAHYVTTDLDEGPIIEQETARVDHTMSPEDLVGIGSDLESVVLNRAVKWHAERRIFINGNKTVVLK